MQQVKKQAEEQREQMKDIKRANQRQAELA